MHIVQMANFYAPRSGGLRTCIDNLGAGYVAQGHRVTLIVAGEERRQETLDTGVVRITLPGPPFAKVEGYRTVNSLRWRPVLARLRPDVTEVSDRLTMRGVGPWSKAHGIGSVMMAHERLDRLIDLAMPHWVTMWASNIANERSSRTFDTVVATTDFAAEEFRRVDAPNVEQVSLGIDIETFTRRTVAPASRAAHLQGAEVLLVHSGRMSLEKCPERSIDTLAEVRRRGVNARLVVAGDGPMLDRMRARAVGLPVTFRGFIADREELAELLACADVALSPGPHETFGLAAMECLASGTPTVVSASSALAQLITTTCGRAAADTAESFADGVLSLLVGPQRLQSLAARAQAERFTWDKTVAAMLTIHQRNADMRYFKRRRSTPNAIALPQRSATRAGRQLRRAG